MDYIVNKMKDVIGIDSPTGYHYKVQQHIVDELIKLGFAPTTLRKGGVIVNLGGEGRPLMLMAHMDTLGCFVQFIKENGRLAISNLTLNPNNIETEQVRVITREGTVFEGTIQLENASIHVNDDINKARSFENLEVVLDSDVKSKADVQSLGIHAGDVIAVEPRFTVTKEGYIKSRYLDDKASVAILLGVAKEIAEQKIELNRNVWLNFTAFEEIGHGAAVGIPDCIEDVLSIDMGCVGENLTCTEKMVSICAKDSAGAYHYEMTNELIEAAKKANVSYAVDVYPHYSSDAQLALKSGYDVRHSLIGPGVYASHGYERTHKDGIRHTFNLIQQYIQKERN